MYARRCFMVWTKMLLKMTIVPTLMGGFLLFGGTPNAHAISRDGCYRNVQNWEYKLNHDVNRHGYNSWQANHDRRELREARYSCQRRFGNSWRERRYYD